MPGLDRGQDGVGDDQGLGAACLRLGVEAGHRVDLLGVRPGAGVLPGAVQGPAAPLGPDRARLDDHHVDAEPVQLEAQAVTEPLHRELAGVVPRAERLAEVAADRGDVEDPTRPGGAHGGNDQLAHPGQSEQVDLELPPSLVQRHVLDRAVRPVARVVDQHVDASLLGQHPVHEVDHRLVVGDVELCGVHALLGQHSHPVGPPRPGIDDVAGLLEPMGRRLPDARRCPRDDCDLVCHDRKPRGGGPPGRPGPPAPGGGRRPRRTPRAWPGSSGRGSPRSAR